MANATFSKPQSLTDCHLQTPSPDQECARVCHLKRCKKTNSFLIVKYSIYMEKCKKNVQFNK